MQDVIREACEAVQAAAPKGKTAIRRMLTAEFQARDFSLPPELFDVLVKQLAAGTYAPGEPLVSVHRSGLLRVPFIRKAIRHALEPALAGHVPAGVVRVTEHLADVRVVPDRSGPDGPQD